MFAETQKASKKSSKIVSPTRQKKFQVWHSVSPFC